jgi:DNA polymerase-3 subunit delta
VKYRAQPAAADTLLGLRRSIRAGEFDPVYLFHLKQAERDKETVEFLIAQLVDAVLAEFRKDPGARFNVDAFEGGEATMAQVIGTARTPPMFGNRRLALYRTSSPVKDDDAAKLIEYIKRSTPTTTLLCAFITAKVPDRLLKTAGSLGYAHRIERIPERSIPRWIAGIFKEEKARISPDAIAVLAEYAGPNLQVIEDARNKLVLYTMGRECVEASDVEELLLSSRSADVYELGDALWSRNVPRVMAVLAQLESQKTDPLFINTILATQARSLISIKSVTAGRRMSSGSVAEMLGLREFIVRKHMASIRHFTLRQFEEALSLCVEMNARLKSSRMPAYRIIEQTAMKILSLQA